MTLTEVAAYSGLCFGLVGALLGVLNYRRDNPKVNVELSWDMTVNPGTEYDPRKKRGIVTVANVGRRPIYVSHAALQLPPGYDETHLILMEGIIGKKLQEGDEPVRFMIDQAGLEKYALDWYKIRAQVNDSAGKAYSSSAPGHTEKPSWAKRKP